MADESVSLGKGISLSIVIIIGNTKLTPQARMSKKSQPKEEALVLLSTRG